MRVLCYQIAFPIIHLNLDAKASYQMRMPNYCARKKG
jgi:hypothetical protein